MAAAAARGLFSARQRRLPLPRRRRVLPSAHAYRHAPGFQDIGMENALLHQGRQSPSRVRRFEDSFQVLPRTASPRARTVSSARRSCFDEPAAL
jgi:hypothetical protein